MQNRSAPSPVATSNTLSSSASVNTSSPSIATAPTMLMGGVGKSVAPLRSSIGMKHYGPPTLESDTVVFQAAKIPTSSARNGSAPLAAAGPSAVLASRGSGRVQGYPPPSGYERHGELYRGVYAPQTASPIAHRAEGYAPSPPSAHHLARTHADVGLRHSGHYGDDRVRYMERDMPRGDAADRAMKKPRTQSRQSRPTSAESANGRSKRVTRLTITVIKEGDKLGFGIRNDSNRKLKVSTLQSNTTASKSSLRIGDTLLSVNGVALHNLGFLEVIQQLKATKPGELVFDVEREIGDDDAGSVADSGSQQGDTAFDMEVSNLPIDGQQPTPVLVRDEYRGSPAIQQQSIINEPPAGPQPPLVPAATGEPRNKRPRPLSGMTPSQMEMEMARTEKQHKAVVSALTLELKKERTEKLSLEEKNVALRKRLQNMLIECDEVRVKASSTVAAIKDQAQREIQELTLALQETRARMRLLDRGPDVARTDSIVNDLVAAKEQLTRLRRIDSERASALSSRYTFESRQAEREALRTRDRLITLFQSQLREVARRHYSNTGVRSGANQSSLVVHVEGIRRFAFAKLFSFPSSFDWYASDEYLSPAPVRHTLSSHDDLLDLFGNVLCHEERAGLFVVATTPMTVQYDPVSEKLTLSCPWTEQNQIRELARNFRF